MRWSKFHTNWITSSADDDVSRQQFRKKKTAYLEVFFLSIQIWISHGGDGDSNAAVVVIRLKISLIASTFDDAS